MRHGVGGNDCTRSHSKRSRSKKSTSPTPSHAQLSRRYKHPIFASSHWLSGARLSHSTIRTNADLYSALYSQPVSSQALASVSTRISLAFADIHPWLNVDFGKKELSIIDISTEFMISSGPNAMMLMAIAGARRVSCTRRLLRTWCGKLGELTLLILMRECCQRKCPHVRLITRCA